MKIVINSCYGGFGVSEEGNKLLKEWGVLLNDVDRDSPHLVKLVEVLGDKVNDEFSRLKIIEIPDDTQWEVGEYDGAEYVYDKRFFWK